MEIFTPKTTRRSTRVRVEIPVVVTSMDRRHVFSAECVIIVVSPQGCGFRTLQALPLETPVLLGDLPGGATATGRVASCVPLGSDSSHFLIGVALYNAGNVWGIANPPQDWDSAVATGTATASGKAGKSATKNGNAWPYNRFSEQGESHPGRK
jgi:hypothetical protein